MNLRKKIMVVLIEEKEAQVIKPYARHFEIIIEKCTQQKTRR
jgi:hypothetical protein